MSGAHGKGGKKTIPLTFRFWSCVNKSETCWIWNASTNDGGYGRIKPSRTVRGQRETPKQAHRISWEIHNGPIPEGLLVLHRCDNPRCVNPEHLFLGTHADNSADMITKGRGKGALRGELHHEAKMNQLQVGEARKLHQQGWTYRNLGLRYGVARETVSRAVRRKTWKHIPEFANGIDSCS